MRANRPKNQNRCWYNRTSPPPAVSKKLVLKLRSVNNIVRPLANTGNDNNINIAVISIDHVNSVSWVYDIPLVRIFIIVTIKFIVLSIDDIPDRCNENIAKSTEGPLCDNSPDNG